MCREFALITNIVAALLFLAGCGRSEGATANVGATKAPFEAVSPGRLRVREDLAAQLAFAPARASDVQATLRGFGRITFAPSASYAVRVPFAAFAERVHVAVGSEIKQGQALATLRSSEVARLRADLRRHAVAVAAEKDAVERLERLVAQGAASGRDLVEAKARLATAEAELLGARESLSAAGVGAGGADRFELTAAAGGQLIARTLDPGERVSPESAEPAFVIGDAQKLVARTAFPERDAPLLQEGAPCWFTVPAVGPDRFEGTVMRAVRAVDARTRAAEADCAPRTVDARLVAQAVARVEVSVKGAPSIVVPRSAVVLRRDDRVVFVRVAPDVLERRVVEVGADLGDQVQVVRGLSEGEEVVVKNAVLFDGELDLIL